MSNRERNMEQSCFNCTSLFNYSPPRKCANVFDEKTKARLERERRFTLKGLLELEARKRNQKPNEERNENGKTNIAEGIEITKQVERPSSYRLTKWSKLKILRLKKEREKREACINQQKRWNFYASLIRLKTNFLHQEWNQSCHLKERSLIRENIHTQNLKRIRRKYKIHETIPSDSIVFDKIMKCERERKKQLKLRKERMLKIVEKITLEMRNGIRLLRRPQEYVKYTAIEKISEESFECKEATESNETVEKIDAQVKEEVEVKIKKKKQESSPENKIQSGKVEQSNDSKKDDTFLEKPIAIKKSDSSSTEIFLKDKCFFANPNVVTFDDFRVDRKYSKKVTITNKSSKWTYLRFRKVFTDIWEPGVIEIDTMDAVRVKPGLHVTIVVKFSPIHGGTVSAEISFVTLTPDHPETFHEFRIPVRCIPLSPVPVIDPKELRFPTAPSWKFDDSKLCERVLTISNKGGKSFSIVLKEQDVKNDCFLWYHDEAEAQSVKSFTSDIKESESDNATENRWNLCTPRKTYQIEIPPGVKCRLRIAFTPRYVGLHHEVLKIRFCCDGKTFHEQDIPIWAEVTGHQIVLNLPCIDLGILTVDTDVCQQNFQIINNGRSSVEVSIKTPKRLGNQVTVHPRSTIVQSDAFSTVNVRLVPESSILDASNRFYDPLSSMLEFPIQVQVVTQDERKPPPLVLKVLANLTTCHGLLLEPAQVDLGFVHTHESVYANLTLTNESLLIQEYGFLNLPPFMEIQPNCGFGTILPGETVKLHLIYSACLRDIPGNDVAANGLTGERRFQVEVASVTEIAGNKKQINSDQLKSSYNMQSIVPRNRGVPPSKCADEKIPRVIHTETTQEQDVLNNSFTHSLVDVEDTEKTVDTSLEKLNPPDRREKRNVIDVVANIVDTFCELSEQIFEFPATPCSSFSIISFDLRGFNMASFPNCTCGIVENQDKKFTARYEFKCSSNRIKILPQSGTLHNNDMVKIHLTFEPRLAQAMILERTRELKTKIEEKTDDNEEDNSKKKKKTRKRKVLKSSVEDKELSDVDKLAGEMNLLETFEPTISTIFVTCEIDIEKKNQTRSEILFAKLICPITRPDILILNEDREIDFGTTAIGTSSRKLILVKNISNENVKVDVSVLNPFGPFFVPPGKTIETGSILKLPITYQPAEEDTKDDQEHFEIFSSRTRTRWRMKVTGRGVVPSYILKPRIGVARFQINDDKPVELKISVQNTGICPLIFQLRVIDLLKGNIPRVEESREKSSKMTRKKGKSDDGSARKSPWKPEFSDLLEAHEELAIFGGNLERSTDRGCFSYWNFDENMQLLVQERKKTEFAIRFQPPKSEDASEKGDASKTSPTKKKRRESPKRKGVENSNYCHVAVLKLFLGNSMYIQDLVIICSIN